MSIADLRQTYDKNVLLEDQAASSPIDQFGLWFDQALAGKVPEPNAMTLATADAAGRPSARIVLLKGYDPDGFVFYTNYESRKGEDLAAQPWASLLFFWQALERQVRIEGPVEKVSAADSDAYYKVRPLGSRIGAWASKQSQPISRDELEARNAQYTASLGEDPPRPPHWGGYRLRPESMEFWQGRPSRLHDRLVYRRDDGGIWRVVRLSP
ncbi:Pyridoxamine 5'-phosphate oxidase [plant metagenome]|uniref:Pyridoxine/pyridoxamine 5'-phosphate oxidase n=2 Tax=root TaxID=1 RepID=A0A1C3K558_9BURK|nr:pyridoxamine 5'-phosphate oxidase [Orrella dioscoreae]SBT26650.1 Pyridoxamine 5'-phosphate oxidase [Orrella dioscoreae]SOE51216.1 Pyridoxamine 5'-phosphate oxidase [Orrella dioscoreae]